MNVTELDKKVYVQTDITISKAIRASKNEFEILQTFS